MDKVTNTTHIFKGQPVRLIELTYVVEDKQFCTIEKLNRLGKFHRQTAHVNNLIEITGWICGNCGRDNRAKSHKCARCRAQRSDIKPEWHGEK